MTMRKGNVFLIFLLIHLVSCSVKNNSIKENDESIEGTSTDKLISDVTAEYQTSTVLPIERTEKIESTQKVTSTTAAEEESEEEPQGPVPCTCGVFLSGQFKKGSKEQPKGVPVLTTEMDNFFGNNSMGNRKCINKCLEVIIKHLPKSGEIICATVDRDHVYKERAYLFVKNYGQKWIGTNLSAGREFCCRGNEPYKCPKS